GVCPRRQGARHHGRGTSPAAPVQNLDRHLRWRRLRRGHTPGGRYSREPACPDHTRRTRPDERCVRPLLCLRTALLGLGSRRTGLERWAVHDGQSVSLPCPSDNVTRRACRSGSRRRSILTCQNSGILIIPESTGRSEFGQGGRSECREWTVHTDGVLTPGGEVLG